MKIFFMENAVHLYSWFQSMTVIHMKFSLQWTVYYPRESFREVLCNHRRWFVALSVCLFVTTITK